jgi:hypothetical protein
MGGTSPDVGPGSGAPFIVGLPAAPEVPRAAIAAAIAVAADAEEVELEERAILRALRAGSRAGGRTGGPSPASPRADGPPSPSAGEIDAA